ncbi:MAG: hypothetical protein GY849_03265 [Deltaproteobacteria bacterium]|nr:hypothetical protein [Deltaproteobacteria bacterium]
MIKNFVRIFLIIFLLTPLLSGCVKLAFRLAPSLVPNLTQAIFEECDQNLAKDSIPADLKLMEGLLKNDPENKELLIALSMGFTGYAMMFVEEDDPERASNLYLRAKAYGIRAIGPKAPLLEQSGFKDENIRNRLNAIGEEEHLKPLFWTVMAWNAWINLNLDKPGALAQLGMAQACLEKVLDIKPDYFYGTPYILMGSLLAARPRMLGGDEAKAKAYFKKAMKVTQGRFFLVHYYYAKHYAVRAQDKGLFLKLINSVASSSPDALKEMCLINAVMKEKIKRLNDKMDELFI